MGRVHGFGGSEGRRVRDQDVQLPAAQDTLQPDAELEPDRPPPHLALRVLVGPLFVANASAKPGDAQPVRLDKAPVDVDASLRTRKRRQL